MKRKKFLKSAGTVLLVLLTVAISIDSIAVSTPTTTRSASSAAIKGKVTTLAAHNVTSARSNTFMILGDASNSNLAVEIAEIIVCVILLFVCLILAMFAFSILSSLWTQSKYKVPPI